MSSQAVVMLARMLAIFLLWAGAWGVLRMPLGGLGGGAPFAAVLILVAGGAIFLQRDWGYYVAYALTAASWLARHSSVSYVPLASWLAQKLVWIGIDKDYTIFAVNLLFVGALAWTHVQIHSEGLLGKPLTAVVHRRLWMTCLALSGLAIVLPAVGFILALFADPPGGRNPGGPSGGMIPLLVVLFSWPFVLTGLIGSVVAWRMLKRPTRLEAAKTDS
jgi:hypothetical protein